MKKNASLQLVQVIETPKIKNETLFIRLYNYKTNAMKRYAKWLSKETGESFTPHETLYGTQAVLSLILSIFTINMPLLIHLLILIWLGISIYQCKHIED